MTFREFIAPKIAAFKDLFSLDLDTDEAGTIENVKKSISFRGSNLWALIFACLIASIGLNGNSTAVIIGAMLISPLMGPIVGVGYSVAVNDWETLKESGWNLGISAGVSIVAAAIYFFISPLKEETAELLARTRPSIYDVLIAVCGGAIGIVASSRKDRGNAIPGVAIATALMPPLCTAGYGLATLKAKFFFGAVYLFCINAVFIAITTFIFVQVLKFPKKEFADQAQEKKVKLYIISIAVITIIPSIFIAYGIIQETIFKTRANQFVENNFKELFAGRTVVDQDYIYNYSDTQSAIELSIFGEPIDSGMIENLNNTMDQYQLPHTRLIVHQNDFSKQLEELKRNNYIDPLASFENFKDIKEAYEQQMRERTSTIQELQLELAIYREADKRKEEALSDLARAVFPEIRSFAYKEMEISTYEDIDSIPGQTVIRRDTIPTVLVMWGGSSSISEVEEDRLRNLVAKQTKHDQVDLVIRKVENKKDDE